jgi:multidrug resistance efflux pump
VCGLHTPKQLVAAQVVARLDNTDAKNQLAQAEFDLKQAEQILANLNSTSALAAAQLDAVNKQSISSALVVLWLLKAHADSGLFSWSISFYSTHHKVRLD